MAYRQAYTVVVENKGTGLSSTATIGNVPLPPRRTAPRPAFRPVAPRTSGFNAAPVSDTAKPTLTPEAFMDAVRAKLAERLG